MTPQDPRPVHLLGLSGSLRRDSYCTAVLRTVQERPGAGIEMTVHPLNGVPPYNQDEDGRDEDGTTPPPAVAALRDAIARADGLVIITPEYNGGMSGVLKNALDWASRPHRRSALSGKPTLVMSASPASAGGTRAQTQLRETLTAILARVVVRPQVAIAGVRDKVRDGRLVDETALRTALGAVDDLVREIRLLSSAKGA